jgi:hypothetical protein
MKMINPNLQRMLIAAEDVSAPELMTILALMMAHNLYENVDEHKRPKALRMQESAIRELLRKLEDAQNKSIN